MIKISHEVPISLFKESLKFNDYDYCLCHLYDKNEKYREFYDASVKRGRNVLLDNSIFELGIAFESSAYAKIIEDLNPTEYIVPDVFNDAEATIESFENWKNAFGKDLPQKTIGVVHGKDYADLKKCMKYMIDQNCRIAFSFADPIYKNTGKGSTDEQRISHGRCKILEMLNNDLLLPYNKNYHLLGCSIPNEYLYASEYNYFKRFFTSLDTSSPVVHGILGIRYAGVDGTGGLYKKEPLMLEKLINTELTKKQKDDIKFNVNAFRKIVEISEYSGR